jgi:hypothetical protein
MKRHGPIVDRQGFIAVVFVIVAMIGIVALNEYYSRHSQPVSLLWRVFHAVFGSGRWLFTWPIVPIATIGLYRLIQAAIRRLFANNEEKTTNNS